MCGLQNYNQLMMFYSVPTNTTLSELFSLKIIAVDKVVKFYSQYLCTFQIDNIR